MNKYQDIFVEAYKAYCKYCNTEYKTPNFKIIEEGYVSINDNVYMSISKESVFIVDNGKDACFFNMKTHQIEHPDFVLA